MRRTGELSHLAGDDHQLLEKFAHEIIAVAQEALVGDTEDKGDQEAALLGVPVARDADELPRAKGKPYWLG